MKTLVAGASGATGKLLVEQLLRSGQRVRIIVRSSGNIPGTWSNHEGVEIIKGNVTEISVDDMVNHLSGCQAVACCLGHNMTWKGIYGKPGKLVAGTVRLICEAIAKTTSEKPIKFVLMNTAGNSNRDLDEPVSFGQRIIIGVLRVLLPPHPDNEAAADHLRVNIGPGNPSAEWVVVRPDTLIDLENVTGYSLYQSPTRSAIFNPGKTSRINVAHFMARLITDEALWNQWKGQMPVIYNDAG